MTGKQAIFVSGKEVISLYKGHEVASHTLNHPDLTKSSNIEILKEVNDDIKNLEKLLDYPILSFAYPFGTFNNEVIKILAQTKLTSARTIKNTYNFNLPDTFLAWHPTCHHNEAYKYVAEFKQSTQPLAVFYIWGHSWEFDYGIEHNSWEYFENLCSQLVLDKDTWSAGAGELSQYLYSGKMLAEKGGALYNNSTIMLYVRHKEKVHKLKPGKKI
jgi:hypothetical protein